MAEADYARVDGINGRAAAGMSDENDAVLSSIQSSIQSSIPGSTPSRIESIGPVWLVRCKWHSMGRSGMLWGLLVFELVLVLGRVNPGREHDIQKISLRRSRGHKAIVDSPRETEYCATHWVKTISSLHFFGY